MNELGGCTSSTLFFEAMFCKCLGFSLKPAHTSPLLSESHKQMIACVHWSSCCQACDLKKKEKSAASSQIKFETQIYAS